jgi:3-oxoadipate enol-lactonase
MTSGWLDRPGASIYYEITGSGPALVFAHGLGGNHMVWWQQVPYFAPRYTCVTFAHRGFAPSRSENPPDPADFADDLAALLDHLGIREAALIAQSMGGWTCLDFSIRYPDRVRALVMSCTCGIADPATLGPAEIAKLQQWASAHAGVEADLFRRGIHPAAGERMAREQPALQFLYREMDQMSAGLDKNALRAKLMAARTLPVSRLAELKMPVLYITGTEDIVIPPPLIEALAARTPGAKLEAVPEAGHSVYFERADWFNQVVDEFLKR